MASSRDHVDGEKLHAIDPFLSLLNNISKEITEAEFKIMKHSCSDKVPKRYRQALSEPIDLFMALKEYGLLSESNNEILKKLLEEAGRQDLKENVEKFNEKETPADMPAGIQWLVDHLKKSYLKQFNKLQPLPWNETFFLYLSDVYTRLEVAEVGERGQKVKRPGFSKWSEHRTVSEREIFGSSGSEPTPKRIIIEGAPAVGKSTFCRKLADDWACGKFDHYKLAFFLEVRHVQNKSIVETIFDQLLPDDSKISKEKLEDFLSANEDSILLIFDGLDEIDNTLKEDAKLDLYKIIQKKLLSNCTVVITSRLHEVDGQLKHCDSHLKINGFTAEDREKYILKYFDDNAESVEKLTKCLNDCYIFLDDDEEVILSNPLNVLYICVFWEDHQNGECFPTKMTDLYGKILECILTRYCTINEIDIDPDNGIDLAKGKVPTDIKTAVDTLAEIAYNTIKEGKTLIQQSDVEPECILSLGLLVRDCGISRLRPRKVCYFSHKTWLEYFTARYIAAHDALLKDTEYMFSDLGSYYVVILFLVGMLKAKAGSVFEYLGTIANKSLDMYDIGERDEYFCLWFRFLRESDNVSHNLQFMEPVINRLSHVVFVEIGDFDDAYFSFMLRDFDDEYFSSMLNKQFMCNQYNLCLHCWYANHSFSARGIFLDMAIAILKYRHSKQGVKESDVCLWLEASAEDEYLVRRLAFELKDNSISLKSLILVVHQSKGCFDQLKLMESAIRETRAIKNFVLVDKQNGAADVSIIRKIIESAFINEHIGDVSLISSSPTLKKIPIEPLEVNGSKQFQITLDSSRESIELAQALTKFKMDIKLFCFFDDDRLMYEPDSSVKSLTVLSPFPDSAILNAAKISTSLQELQLSLSFDNILSMSELIETNTHIKTLACQVIISQDSRDESAFFADKAISQTFKQLAALLCSNQTLESFAFRILNLDDKLEAVHLHNSVLTDLLLPVHSFMNWGLTCLKNVTYQFASKCKNQNEEIMSYLMSEFQLDVTSYQIYVMPGFTDDSLKLHMISVQRPVVSLLDSFKAV